MASVYSSRFAAEAIDNDAVSYEVPGGVLWIVRDVDIVLQSPGSGIMSVGLLDGPAFALLAGTELPAPQLYSWRGRQVLYAGEGLQLISEDVNATFYVSGYVLTLP